MCPTVTHLIHSAIPPSISVHLSSPSSHPYALIYSTISVLIHYPMPSSFYYSFHPFIHHPTRPSLSSFSISPPVPPYFCLLNHTSHSHNHLVIHQAIHPTISTAIFSWILLGLGTKELQRQLHATVEQVRDSGKSVPHPHLMAPIKFLCPPPHIRFLYPLLV